MSRFAFYKRNTPPHWVKIKGIPLGISAALLFPALFALFLLATSCAYDNFNASEQTADGSTQIQLSITTRAINSDVKDYVDGSLWENYIDIEGGDYRIYFFDTGNRFIGVFEPTDIYSTDTGLYTTYYASGQIDKDLVAYTDLKVVVLANWGEEHYPTNDELVSVSEDAANATTIDDICNAQTAVFNAFIDGNGDADIPSESLRIPFYGVHEYTGLGWKAGWRTNLTGAITLLRAVAKVEFILTNPVADSLSFESVVLHGYNVAGYCAPENVYSQDDYDSGYTDWDADFTNTVHLVNTDASGNGANDADQSGREITLRKGETADGLELWYAYIPEYDNSGDDYCYITAFANYQLPEDDPYRVYFGNYYNGTTTAYDEGGDADDRFDVFRNNLYRFNVTLTEGNLYVSVQAWNYVFDNEWSFGEMSHIEEEGAEFTFDGITYEVKVVRELEEGEEDETASYGYHLEVWITQSTSKYTGEFVIPETVTHFGYTYTITGIEGNCFFGDEDLISVQIPATVTWIGNEAFGECTSLQSVYILATTPPECGEDIFHEDVTDDITIFVPVGCREAYEAHETWGQFNISETNY